MKTLPKALAGAVLAGCLLTGGTALATAADNTPATVTDSLTRLITLKPGTVTVSDQLGESTTKGTPWISQDYPFSQNSIPASEMLTAANGTTWRAITMDNCGAPSTFFLSDSDVATDVERPAAGQGSPLVGSADATDAAITAYAEHFTGTATLKPTAAIYASYGSQAEPLYRAANGSMTVPATEAFDADGAAWVQIIAPGMTEGYVRAGDVAEFEPTACVPAAPVDGDTDLYGQIKAAAYAAIADRDTDAVTK